MFIQSNNNPEKKASGCIKCNGKCQTRPQLVYQHADKKTRCVFSTRSFFQFSVRLLLFTLSHLISPSCVYVFLARLIFSVTSSSSLTWVFHHFFSTTNTQNVWLFVFASVQDERTNCKRSLLSLQPTHARKQYLTKDSLFFLSFAVVVVQFDRLAEQMNIETFYGQNGKYSNHSSKSTFREKKNYIEKK